MTLIILFYALSSKKPVSENTKLFRFIALGSALAVMIATFSRGGWFALASVVGLYGILWKPKYIFIGIVFVVSLYVSSDLVRDRLNEILDPMSGSSVTWRFTKWAESYAIFVDSPIIGYGIDSQQAVHERYYGYGPGVGNFEPHNEFVRYAVDLGLVGLFFYCLMLASILYILYKKYKNQFDEDKKLFILLVLFAFIAQIQFSLTSNTWNGTAMFWVMFTLIAFCIRQEDKVRA
jgi:O-antigen ligase